MLFDRGMMMAYVLSLFAWKLESTWLNSLHGVFFWMLFGSFPFIPLLVGSMMFHQPLNLGCSFVLDPNPRLFLQQGSVPADPCDLQKSHGNNERLAPIHLGMRGSLTFDVLMVLSGSGIVGYVLNIGSRTWMVEYPRWPNLWYLYA